MSKSYDNHIELFGDPKATKKRVMRIVTDCTPLEEPKDPATCNVFKLYRLFATPAQRAEMESRYRAGGFGYGEAKTALFEVMTETLSPFRARREALAADPAYVEQVLQDGAARARAEAGKTLAAARQAMGLA